MGTMRLLFTLITLAFVQLFFNMAHASPHTPVNANQHKADSNSAREDERRKRRPVKVISTRKIKEPLTRKAKELTARSVEKKSKVSLSQRLKLKKSQEATAAKEAKVVRNSKTVKKHYGRERLALVKLRKGSKAHLQAVEHDEHDEADAQTSPLKLSKTHRARYQKARETAMNKLMGQLGKPYQWGGTSPKTGFDCSGLVWYAYKDLVKFKIPRTANEMYHLRDAAPIKRDRLEKGDLVFFRITGRGSADHVGVYLGDGKFIQSPRTGKDIQVSALSDDYWQEHYIGARRMMTPKTIR